MELLSGFGWPLPRAFAGAVSACRFEQGDVFYSDPVGYQTWVVGGARPSHCIQVLDPPKSVRALSGEADGHRFLANWTSPVELTLTQAESPAGPSIVTTQGRLFTGLWRGDANWLAQEGEDPEPPRMQRDLHKRLDELADYFHGHFDERLGAGSRCLYLAAVDEASDASLVKAQAIESLLTEHARGETERATPVRAGLPDAELFHPALVLLAVATPVSERGHVEELLEGLLYAGGGGESGRFSLSRHGLLVSSETEEGADSK